MLQETSFHEKPANPHHGTLQALRFNGRLGGMELRCAAKDGVVLT